jgi:hypothetical protein
MNKTATYLLAMLFVLGTLSKANAAPVLEQIGEFVVPEANQGVGVDTRYFYAVDNYVIGKYEKKTGKLVKRWQGDQRGPIVHLDSAMVMNGKIYAAHSNYPDWPDDELAGDLRRRDHGAHRHAQLRYSVGFAYVGGLARRSLVDDLRELRSPARAGQDAVRTQGEHGHGEAHKDFRPLQSWTMPKAILDRFGDMSNSGGSWGPDGYLYLSGHDPAELYRMRLPKAGSVLELVDIIPMNIRGQGIAWDRSQPGVIYGIIRATSKERAGGGGHKVTVFRLLEKPQAQ